MVNDYKAKIKKIKDLSKTVKEFTLDLGNSLEFKAGQFVNLSFEDNGENLKRAYSIASNPEKDSNEIKLCIKLVEGGHLTPKLFEKKENDYVNIKAPLGIFTLDKVTKNKLVFIGTGTGIAPLRSMILDEISKQKNIRDSENEEGISENSEIVLIFGVRYENEILYKEEFEKLAEDNPNFKYVQVISKPSDDWQGRKGHVQDNFDMIDVNNSNVFICGLPAMFDGTKEKLIQMGMNDKDIFHEVFR